MRRCRSLAARRSGALPVPTCWTRKLKVPSTDDPEATPDHPRRWVLATLGGATVGLAGCIDDPQGTATPADATPTGGDAPSGGGRETATPFDLTTGLTAALPWLVHPVPSASPTCTVHGSPVRRRSRAVPTRSGATSASTTWSWASRDPTRLRPSATSNSWSR